MDSTDPLSGGAGDIAKRMRPEDAIRQLEASIATLNRHAMALEVAKKQLEEKKSALQHLISPFEADIVQVF